MASIIDKILVTYESGSLQTIKKARVLLYTCLALAIADIPFVFIMYATGAFLPALACTFLLLFCAVTIWLIYTGRYHSASYVFLVFLFLVMFSAIKFDLYVNVYETYVFSTLGLVLIVMSSLVGFTRFQLYLMMVLSIGAILVLYFFDILPNDFYIVNPLHIQNLATSIVMVILGSITGIILIGIQKNLLSIVEDEKDEIQRMLRITEVYTKKSLIDIITDGDDPTNFIPKGEEIAILFCDIRDFTGIAEHMRPIETIRFLNSYFDQMNTVISLNKGEIDKLIGDCIMASFPHSKDAVTASFEMKRALQAYNRDRCKTGEAPVRTGIGISYGSVVIGNIGSESKMDYTVIGDVVNASSRLEALTKHYGIDIITSEEIIQQSNITGDYRFIDVVRVKGRTQPIKIYEIFEHEPDWIKEKKFSMQPSLDEAFSLYSKAQFRAAFKIYKELLGQAGKHRYKKKFCADPVINFYLHRCVTLVKAIEAGFIKKEKWNGIYSFGTK